METVSPETAIKVEVPNALPNMWPRVVRATWIVAAALAVLIFVAALPAAHHGIAWLIRG